MSNRNSSETDATDLEDLLGTEVPGRPEASSVPPVAPSWTRYRDEGVLGRGAMGEVRRVFDHLLGRVVAMKIIQPRVNEIEDLRVRFLAEARVCAQLQHPGIVPVYDHGTLSDGRAWFTMPEVRGRTLRAAISEAHGAGVDEPALRRLVGWFQRVCEAVAYAHGRGVVHRDLKPTNVMLGEHGEVLVLDWGIAKVLGDPPSDLGVMSGRPHEHATQTGEVTGTPAFMAPEIARGDTTRASPATDVYSLGCVLYTILAGVPPYVGAGIAILARLQDGEPPPPLSDAEGLLADVAPLPPPLVAACERAMAAVPDDRFPDASALATEVAAWLDGAERGARARELVRQAEAVSIRAAALRTAADEVADAAERDLQDLEPWAPETEKVAAWDRADRAATNRREAERLDLEAESLLRAALAYVPRLTEAHAALARKRRAEHEAAEAERRLATRVEASLRRHALALPVRHPDRASHLRWLEGTGTLHLRTDPPGASARLFRYSAARRRLTPVEVAELGPTPLEGVSVAHGSYLLELRHPAREVVRLPLRVGRGETWRSVAPGETEDRPVRLPARGSVRPDERFVPAGWFFAGGDPRAVEAVPGCMLWVDDWVVEATHVTNAAYLKFLDDLVARGRTDDAMRFVPRERAGTPGDQGPVIYGFDGRRFSLRVDADGDAWTLDEPVLMIDVAGAEAYAAWRAEGAGEPWQLLPEMVWEKAARGVDGRAYPWGDAFDPTFAAMRRSRPGRALPFPVGSFPVDESPYGVRDMGGNAATWCADEWASDGPSAHGGRVMIPSPQPEARRIIRGGTWNDSAEYLRVARRNFGAPNYRSSLLGVRIGRPL